MKAIKKRKLFKKVEINFIGLYSIVMIAFYKKILKKY